MGLKENFHKVGNWLAWYGSILHIRRLLKIIEKSSRQHVNKIMSELPSQSRAQIDRTHLDMRIRCTSKGRDKQVLFGDAGDLANWLEGRTFDRLELSSPIVCAKGHLIQVILDRYDGVTLRVDSRDAAWARSVYAELESELKLRSPALSKVRKASWSYPLCFLFSSALIILGVDILAKVVTETGKYDNAMRVPIFALMTIAVLLATVLLPTAMRRFVPAFEVLPQGKDSKASIMGRSLIGSISAVVLGVIVEAFTRAYMPEKGSDPNEQALLAYFWNLLFA